MGASERVPANVAGGCLLRDRLFLMPTWPVTLDAVSFMKAACHHPNTGVAETEAPVDGPLGGDWMKQLRDLRPSQLGLIGLAVMTIKSGHLVQRYFCETEPLKRRGILACLVYYQHALRVLQLTNSYFLS